MKKASHSFMWDAGGRVSGEEGKGSYNLFYLSVTDLLVMKSKGGLCTTVQFKTFHCFGKSEHLEIKTGDQGSDKSLKSLVTKGPFLPAALFPVQRHCALHGNIFEC